MGQPQSYKDLFKNIKQKKQIASPIPPQVLRTKTLAQAKEDERQTKEFVKFANEQRCGVCGDQLDGPVWMNRANLYCVSNNEHFKQNFNSFKRTQYIYALYSFHDIEYEIIANLGSAQYNNYIFKLDKHLIPKYRQQDKKKLFAYESDTYLEFPKNLSQEEFEQSMKIFITFS